MNPKTWRPEDGQLLQNLRLKAGIDSHVFARNNTLSHAQLQELESGVGHSFYSELIKHNAGVKLLKKLGYEPAEPVTQEPEAVLEELTAKSDTKPTQVISRAERPSEAAEAKTRLAPHKIMIRPVIWMGILLSLAVVTVVSLKIQSPLPNQRFQDQLPQSHNAQPDGQISASQSTEYLEKPVSLEPSAVPASTVPERAPIASIACEDVHRKNSKLHTTSNPLKPGNYIYIEAKADSELCVLDSDNKLSILALKAGMNQKVNGLAPFLLHTSNWQGLQVFFQGRLVHTELGDSSHLLLQSLPH